MSAERVGLAFPGVGVPPSGAEYGLYQKYQEVMHPFISEASDHAGFDFEKALSDGDPGRISPINQEFNSYTFGCALSALLSALGHRPTATAGLSLGVYGAAFAAGAITFSEGLTLVGGARAAVSACMAGSPPAGMGTIVGMDLGEIEEVISAHGKGVVNVANSMSPLAHVLSGDRGTLELCLNEADNRGAMKTHIFDTDIPYHSPGLLRNVPGQFARFSDAVKWQDPKCPVVSAITGEKLRDSASVKKMVTDNLFMPIRWIDIGPVFAEMGVTMVVECGIGVSITQNAGFIENSPPHVSSRTIKKLLNPKV